MSFDLGYLQHGLCFLHAQQQHNTTDANLKVYLVDMKERAKPGGVHIFDRSTN